MSISDNNKTGQNPSALIAMSGGVDSSVAACLMKQNGFNCVGVTMKLFYNDDAGIPENETCCGLDDIEDARRVSAKIGIPHHVFNFAGRFRECVINPFIEYYENGMTPNPCIECNRHLKFSKLFELADIHKLDYVVTGHYARVEKDEATGRILLKKALDPSKDQSYVLYALNQEQLSRIRFPLGEYTKQEIRKIADENGFINADKPDSQDICFVPDGKYAEFIEQYTGRTYPEGDFVDINGKVLGRHKGIIHYTIGQRKGLGVAYGEPLYVKEIDPANNRVVLARDEELYTSVLFADNVNLISVPDITEPLHVKAKIRYRHKEADAVVTKEEDGRIRIEFDSPQRAVTRGQAVVLYDGDVVVGGGRIVG